MCSTFVEHMSFQNSDDGVDNQFPRIRCYARRSAIPDRHINRRYESRAAARDYQLDGRVKEIMFNAGTKLGRYEIRSQLGDVPITDGMRPCFRESLS